MNQDTAHIVYFDFSSIETPGGTPITDVDEAQGQFLGEFVDAAREAVKGESILAPVGLVAYRFVEVTRFTAMCVLYFSAACTPEAAAAVIQEGFYDAGGLSGRFQIAPQQTFHVSVGAPKSVPADRIIQILEDAIKNTELNAWYIRAAEVNHG